MPATGHKKTVFRGKMIYLKDDGTWVVINTRGEDAFFGK